VEKDKVRDNVHDRGNEGGMIWSTHREKTGVRPREGESCCIISVCLISGYVGRLEHLEQTLSTDIGLYNTDIYRHIRSMARLRTSQ
jgi:hypothetical protein